MDADCTAGRPLVAHVVVALCDNKSQGIQPVPAFLGNGQDLKDNLYWGASLGVRSFFTRKAGWRRIAYDGPKPEGVLERIVLTRTLNRPASDSVRVYIVADAWDGSKIRSSIETFLKMSAGRLNETVTFDEDERKVSLAVGHDAHAIAYVGHNGLMDFTIPPIAKPAEDNSPKAAIVLACRSRFYFESRLTRLGVYPLLLTNGLMCPEAYTLDAALRTWFTGGDADAVRESAAAAYHRHQDCGLRAARWLFRAE